MARYIDADKLLDELQEELEFESSMYTEEQNKYINVGLRIAIKDTRAMPAADVTGVKHGKWEDIRDAYGHLEGWIHICGRTVNCKEKFCPHCGAKMDIKD